LTLSSRISGSWSGAKCEKWIVSPTSRGRCSIHPRRETGGRWDGFRDSRPRDRTGERSAESRKWREPLNP
jgi:hypothetical protein